jgi:hypothetical protein
MRRDWALPFIREAQEMSLVLLSLRFRVGGFLCLEQVLKPHETLNPRRRGSVSPAHSGPHSE